MIKVNQLFFGFLDFSFLRHLLQAHFKIMQEKIISLLIDWDFNLMWLTLKMRMIWKVLKMEYTLRGCIWKVVNGITQLISYRILNQRNFILLCLLFILNLMLLEIKKIVLSICVLFIKLVQDKDNWVPLDIRLILLWIWNCRLICHLIFGLEEGLLLYCNLDIDK